MRRRRSSNLVSGLPRLAFYTYPTRAFAQRTGGEARGPGIRKKGVRWRERDALKGAFLRLLLPPPNGVDGQLIVKGAGGKSMAHHRDRYGPATTRVINAIAERGGASTDRQLCVVSPGKRAATGRPNGRGHYHAPQFQYL